MTTLAGVILLIGRILFAGLFAEQFPMLRVVESA
jgi:hypothetical protein